MCHLFSNGSTGIFHEHYFGWAVRAIYGSNIFLLEGIWLLVIIVCIMDGEPSNDEPVTRPSSSRLQMVKLTAIYVPGAELLFNIHGIPV